MQLRALFDFDELSYCIYSILRLIVKYSIKRFIILFLTCVIFNRIVKEFFEFFDVDFSNIVKQQRHIIDKISIRFFTKSF